MGKSCNRVIRLHRLDPIKKGRLDYPFCPKFFRRPKVRVRTDKILSGPSPSSEFDRSESELLF